jgi:hypothetical protein
MKDDQENLQFRIKQLEQDVQRMEKILPGECEQFLQSGILTHLEKWVEDAAYLGPEDCGNFSVEALSTAEQKFFQHVEQKCLDHVDLEFHRYSFQSPSYNRWERDLISFRQACKANGIATEEATDDTMGDSVDEAAVQERELGESWASLAD